MASRKSKKTPIAVGPTNLPSVYCRVCGKKVPFTVTGYLKPASGRGGINVQGHCKAGHETWSIISRDDALQFGVGKSGGCPCAYGGGPADDVTEEPVIDAPYQEDQAQTSQAPAASSSASSSKSHRGSAVRRSKSKSHSRKSRTGGKSHSRKSRKSRSHSRSRTGGKSRSRSRSHSRKSRPVHRK